jgi:hypothetical protein
MDTVSFLGKNAACVLERLANLLFRWNILTSELKRFWQFYIGQPVTPRNWEFNPPRVDEL